MGFICVCWPNGMDLCHRIYNICVRRGLRARLVQILVFMAALSKVTQLVTWLPAGPELVPMRADSLRSA